MVNKNVESSVDKVAVPRNDEPKYSLELYQQRSQKVLDIPRHTFDAVVYYNDLKKDKEYTVSQMQGYISKYRNHKV